MGWPQVFGLPVAACGDAPEQGALPQSATNFVVGASCRIPLSQPANTKNGSFVMGSDAVYAEEGPPRETHVDGFCIDPHEVTNRQCAAFVKSTGHIWVAEKPVDPAQFGVPLDQVPAYMLGPGSAAFAPSARPSRNHAASWDDGPGDNWKKFYGPNRPHAVRDEPVVHLACDEMQAYAKWRGG